MKIMYGFPTVYTEQIRSNRKRMKITIADGHFSCGSIVLCFLSAIFTRKLY